MEFIFIYNGERKSQYLTQMHATAVKHDDGYPSPPDVMASYGSKANSQLAVAEMAHVHHPAVARA